MAPADAASGGLRGRVEQQVDAIADSANKVISGVVDSSFGILRSFMPAGNNPGALSPSGRTTPNTPGSISASLPKPGFGLLRRESGFSIASLAASLPITGRSRANTTTEESGQQLVTVSRPSSIRSRSSLKIRVGDESQGDSSDDGDESLTTDDDQSEVDGEDGEEAEEENGDVPRAGDAKRIRSFESMLSASKEKPKGTSSHPRKTLSDRLASVSALASLKVSFRSSFMYRDLDLFSRVHPRLPLEDHLYSNLPYQSLLVVQPRQGLLRLCNRKLNYVWLLQSNGLLSARQMTCGFQKSGSFYVITGV